MSNQSVLKSKSDATSVEKSLIEEAVAARKTSYAPYSKFNVGCALIAEKNGTTQVFDGCNVENASYGLCICAERVAICKAVSAGFTKFLKLAVDAGIDDVCLPCGACRQFISEFDACGELQVICIGKKGTGFKSFTMSQLLPESFNSTALSQ